MNTASGRQEPAETSLSLCAAMFGEAPLPVWINWHGAIVYANPACVTLLDAASADGIIGRSPYELIHPESHEQVHHRMDAALAGSSPASPWHERLVRFDGTLVDVEVTAWAIPFAGDRALCVSLSDVGARLAAERTIHDQKTRLELAIEGARMGAWDWDLISGSVVWSPSWFTIHGVDPAAPAQYKVWASITHPEDLRRIEQAIAEARRARVPSFEADYRIALPDGSQRWIHTRGKFVFDESGEARGMIGIVMDITDAKRAQQDIAELQRKLEARVQDFESLFETMPIALGISFDPECRDVRVNSEFARLLGAAGLGNVSKTGPQADRLPFRFMHGGQEVPGEHLPQQRAQREGRPVERAELEIVRNDGSHSFVYGSAVPLFDTAGRVRGSIGAFVDTTERKAAEAALHEAAQRLESHLHNSPLAVVEFDPEFRVTRWSDAAERLFGWRASEVIGRSIGEMRWVHDEDTGLVRRLMAEMLSGTRRTSTTNRNYRKDGSTIECEWYNSALLDVRGNLSSVLSLILDVTERNRTDRELKRINDELRRANADLEQFAYAAAHDLQEPIRTVVTLTQLFAKEYGSRTDPSGQQLLETTVHAGMRMHALVKDLLSFTRALDRPDNQQPATDSVEVLRAVTANLSAAIDEAGAVVTHDPLPVVTMYPAHLTQVLQNLIGNSLKYCHPERRCEIHVSASEDQQSWTFAVCDNGQGIEPKYRERIFGVFKRLHGREIPGTGIGLAVCHRIIGHYGGRIWVEDTAGGGATFFFTIPRGRD